MFDRRHRTGHVHMATSSRVSMTTPSSLNRRISGLGFRVGGLRFRVGGLGFRFEGLGLGV